jgi:hypothetical protein
VSGRPGTTRYLQPLDPSRSRSSAEPPRARESPYFPWGYPPLPDPTPVATEHLLDQALASRAGAWKDPIRCVGIFPSGSHPAQPFAFFRVRLCEAL